LLWAVLVWAAQSAGYWIRPYDMLADRRRWRWQPRQRCGFSYGLHIVEGVAPPMPSAGTPPDFED